MTTPQQQTTMTLAALASTCAAPRPPGENPDQHASRIFAGISSYLSDTGLATGGTWAPVWLAMSPDNANLCYIARNNAPGKNEFAVSIRGTYASLVDILEDIDVGTVVPFTAGGSPKPITVSKGSMDAFTQTVNARSPLPPAKCGDYPGTTLSQALATILKAAPSTPTVYVTGHSLGGCLASMVALYLQAQQWTNTPAFAVYTFAAPTAGLADFASYFTTVKWAAYNRIMNAFDMVPQAWVTVDLQNARNTWYPAAKGPVANPEVKGIIDLFIGRTKGNVYVQPGTAIELNNDPQYQLYDPNHVNPTVDDFMGQAAFQHANNSYLTLLGAPIIPPGPSVTSMTPSAGQPGTSVTISGSGFTQDSVVDFGPIPCQAFTVGSASQIIAVVPDGAGIVEVSVTNVFGSSQAAPGSRFAYGKPQAASSDKSKLARATR